MCLLLLFLSDQTLEEVVVLEEGGLQVLQHSATSLAGEALQGGGGIGHSHTSQQGLQLLQVLTQGEALVCQLNEKCILGHNPASFLSLC